MSSENQVFSKPVVRKNHIDRLVKSKVDLLDLQTPPISGWSKENTWDNIRRQLTSTNKNVVVWGLAMAASISLVVAASINLTNTLFTEETQNLRETAEIQKSKPSKSTFPETHNKRPVHISKVSSVKNITQSAHLNHQIETTSIPDVNSDTYQTGLLRTELIERQIVFSPTTGISYNTSFQSPALEFGIDFNILSRNKGPHKKDVDLGVSTTIQRISDERGEQIKPFAFFDVEYSIYNVQTEKGWSFRTGILLNKGVGPFQRNTFKFSANRQFNKHIKAGPEVIFTDNFSRVYPGVKIVFS